MASYGLNPELADSYRRTLVFNNSLLIREFSERYDFRISERVRKARAQGVSESEIAKYERRQAELKPRREERYRERLEANVEPSVRRYAQGIQAFLTGVAPD